MQGEGDSVTEENANNYRVYFDNFIKDFKGEFSQHLKNCIFADAGISEKWNFYREINEFKKEYAQSQDNFVYIDTIANGLTTEYEPTDNPDTAHYDCESTLKLGKLFAEKIA